MIRRIKEESVEDIYLPHLSKRRRKFKCKFKDFMKKRTIVKKGNGCFICRKIGHFAKNCPKRKASKMVQQIREKKGVDHKDNNVESLFSEDSDPTSDALFKSQDFSSNCFTIESEEEYFATSECLSYSLSTAHAKIHVMLDKYSMPCPRDCFL